MRAGLVACDHLAYSCGGRFGCCVDVFGANPASSLVPVGRGFVVRFRTKNERRTVNGHVPSWCYISTA